MPKARNFDLNGSSAAFCRAASAASAASAAIFEFCQGGMVTRFLAIFFAE